MSRSISEDNEQKQISRTGFGQRQLFRRPAERSFKGAISGLIYPTDELVFTDTPAGGWFFYIPEDLDGVFLRQVSASFYSPSLTGSTELTIQSSTFGDLLTTHMTIDINEFNTFTASVPPVLGTTSGYSLPKGRRLYVDLISTPGDAFGLEVALAFA